MPNSRYRNAFFVLSVYTFDQLPEDNGIEVAFAGRSNAGKSSALNAITQNKRLARTSKIPGRTQAINFFEVDSQKRLVDLPGYGYASVPKQIKRQWQQLLMQYLERRKSLQGLVLIMDIRHPLKELDQQLLARAETAQLSTHILLTKADKLSRTAAFDTLNKLTKQLSNFKHPLSIQLFSATKKIGLDEALEVLNNWFYPHDNHTQPI